MTVLVLVKLVSLLEIPRAATPRGIPRRSCKKQRAGGTLAATFSFLSATKGSFAGTQCRLRNMARKIGKNEALFEFCER